MQRYFLRLLLPFILLYSITLNAQCQLLNSPSLGRITAIAYHNNSMFISSNNKLLKSTDNGVTWQQLSNGIAYASFTSLLSNDSYIVGGTYQSGVAFSNDEGNSWVYKNNGLTSLRIKCLAYTDNKMLVGTFDSGIFFSTNNGDQWASLNDGLLSLGINSFYVDNSEIYATTNEGGVYKFDFQENNWVSIGNGLPNSFEVKAISKYGDYLFLGTNVGLFYSFNGGDYWIAGSDGIENCDVNFIKTFNNSVFVFTEQGGSYISTNYGIDWISIGQNFDGQNVTSVFITDSVITAGTAIGEIYKSESGLDWAAINQGVGNMVNPDVRGLLYTSNGKLFVTTYGGKFYLSNNNGVSWENITEGTNCTNGYTFAELNNYVFACTDNGLYRTSIDSVAWETVHNGLTNIIIGSIAGSGNNIYVGTRGSGVFCSTNNGESWTHIGLDGLNALSLAVKNNMVFAGTAEAGVYVTENNGGNWVKVGYQSVRVNALSVVDNYLYVGTNNFGLFRVVIGENDWYRLDYGIPYYATVRYLTNYKTNLLVGTEYTGLYVSYDDGNTFQMLNEGFPNNPSVRAVVYSENALFAGLTGGVYKAEINGSFESITDANFEIETPTEFTLTQNYPNPFNPSTTISFSLPTAQNVTLKVYDILGKEVATLVNEDLRSGNYSRQFDASNLASGMYVYSLKAGNYTETKKMLLMK